MTNRCNCVNLMSTEDLTLVICPGINNSSESEYIRTFVTYCQKQGYRVAVLNHLGAIRYIPLTSPRMFTYGICCGVLLATNCAQAISLFEQFISINDHCCYFCSGIIYPSATNVRCCCMAMIYELMQ